MVAEAREMFDAGDYRSVIEFCDPLLPTINTNDVRFKILLLKACAEGELRLYADCLGTLKLAGPLIDAAAPIAKARFHAQRAYVRVKLDKKDEALVDYEAAKFWAETAGDDLTVASIRNNLGKVYSGLDRFDEAIAESEAAIAHMRTLDNPVYLGKAYDQRAQILIDHGRYSEALDFSEKALNLLADHPDVAEARATHGQALIGMGEEFLHHPDLVEDFRMRRNAVESIDKSAGKEVVSLALERCAGNVKLAAAVLRISHPALLKSIRRHNLGTSQAKHLHRSIINRSK